MARGATEISALIKRLDKSDGTIDGRYRHIPLSDGNTTGTCLQANAGRDKIATGELPPGQISVSLEVEKDRFVSIDCEALEKKLATLVEMVEKNRATAFLAHPEYSKKTKPRIKRMSFVDLWAYHVVDAMICSLLLADVDSAASFGSIFKRIDIAKVSAKMAGHATSMTDYERFNRKAKSTNASYLIFRRFGNRSHVDTKPFDPRGVKDSAKPKVVDRTISK